MSYLLQCSDNNFAKQDLQEKIFKFSKYILACLI